MKTEAPPTTLLQGSRWVQAGRRGSSTARGRPAVADHGQGNVYLEGVRTSTGVWLFMARKLTGKGLLAFLLCHFIPRLRPSWQHCLLSMDAPEMGEALSLVSGPETRGRVVTDRPTDRVQGGQGLPWNQWTNTGNATFSHCHQIHCCKSLSCTSQIVWMLS